MKKTLVALAFFAGGAFASEAQLAELSIEPKAVQIINGAIYTPCIQDCNREVSLTNAFQILQRVSDPNQKVNLLSEAGVIHDSFKVGDVFNIHHERMDDDHPLDCSEDPDWTCDDWGGNPNDGASALDIYHHLMDYEMVVPITQAWLDADRESRKTMLMVASTVPIGRLATWIGRFGSELSARLAMETGAAMTATYYFLETEWYASSFQVGDELRLQYGRFSLWRNGRHVRSSPSGGSGGGGSGLPGGGNSGGSGSGGGGDRDGGRNYVEPPSSYTNIGDLGCRIFFTRSDGVTYVPQLVCF